MDSFDGIAVDPSARRYRTAFTRESLLGLNKEFYKESYVSRPKCCEFAAQFNAPKSTIKLCDKPLIATADGIIFDPFSIQTITDNYIYSRMEENARNSKLQENKRNKVKGTKSNSKLKKNRKNRKDRRVLVENNTVGAIPTVNKNK